MFDGCQRLKIHIQEREFKAKAPEIIHVLRGQLTAEADEGGVLEHILEHGCVLLDLCREFTQAYADLMEGREFLLERLPCFGVKSSTKPGDRSWFEAAPLTSQHPVSLSAVWTTVVHGGGLGDAQTAHGDIRHHPSGSDEASGLLLLLTYPESILEQAELQPIRAVWSICVIFQTMSLVVCIEAGLL